MFHQKVHYNNTTLKDRRRKLRREQTDVEKILWHKLRNKQINHLKFYRQYSVGSFVLDFFCPAMRLAVELDGGQHLEESKQKYDKQRTEFLSNQDIKVLRFWNREILENLDGILQVILAECHNAPRPPLTLRGGDCGKD